MGSTVKIESTIKKDAVLYRLIQYNQGEDTTITPDRFYELNLQDNSITQIK